MRYLAYFNDDLMTRLTGVDVATEVELVRYIFGDHFIPGSFEFSGVTVPYPVTANYVHDSFIRHVDGWLCGRNPVEDLKWCHFVEYWRSALQNVNGVYFKYRRSRSGARAAQGCLQRVLMCIRDYDVEDVKQGQLSCDGESCVVMQDSGLRKKTADTLKHLFDHDQSLPIGLRELWEMAQAPDFAPSRTGYAHRLDPAEDVPSGFTLFDC